MAAGQKAVGSTATMQERDQESQEQAQGVPREYLTAKGHAGHSVKARKENHSAKAVHSVVTDHGAHSARVQKDHADHSEKDALSAEKEEASVRTLKEDHSVKDVHSVVTDHAAHLARVLTDHAGRSVKAVHSEARESLSVEKEEVADSETLQRRA